MAKFTYQPFDYVKKMYVIGTPDEVAGILKTWMKTSGIRQFLLNPITDYVAQIEVLAKEVLPRLA